MAARSVTYGAAIAAGSVVNQPATFFLQTRDEHGNDCTAATAAARCVRLPAPLEPCELSVSIPSRPATCHASYAPPLPLLSRAPRSSYVHED